MSGSRFPQSLWPSPGGWGRNLGDTDIDRLHPYWTAPPKDQESL